MSKRNLAVVILAAGQGTRMKSAKPKVMHEIAGLPMIKHVIKAAEGLKPSHIVVVRAPSQDEVAETAKPHFSTVQPQAMGTADALKCGTRALPDDFTGDVLMIYGDTPLVSTHTLNALVTHHRAFDVAATILAFVPPEPTGYGRIFQNGDGTLKEIIEEKDASAEQRAVRICNSGLAVYRFEKLMDRLAQIKNENAKAEFYVTDLPPIMQAEGEQCGVTRGDYYELRGVNDRAQLAEMELAWQHLKRLEMMQNGVTLQDPNTVYFAHDTKIAADAVIGQHVVFGAGVVIEENVILKAFSHIEGAHIKANATVGPFVRLRPGAEIGADAKIGNFVEIKNSKLEKGVKVSHLAYVGDAEIGANTNFGCGAVTVNYDGKNKHKTIIGKDVMVGCNVNLVAPVTVEDNAYLAAGSTITETVPKDALAIAREKQTTKENWKKK
ncbi:MAG: bifunctional UDP-N-acetylglucosamine diphosphorylase/glucosamine-1-phosphate N-acetyltransferase GlmU [Alphaproteobacteria bacterium]|nr:bifunctional UDP-N-acetylglucosamine diphosphorylase/glucosamine-1-phosphate N-acetyltransferase GlmU [Alphaproteobacteria bacterium]